MAEVFYRTGMWFDGLPEEASVDMSETYSDSEAHKCSSPACFGGWLSIMFSTEKVSGLRYYYNGASMFAKELGFIYEGFAKEHGNAVELTEWAQRNPEIWGNSRGRNIFSNGTAFAEKGGYNCEHNLTVKHISEKLIAVAKRLDKDVAVKFAKKDTGTPATLFSKTHSHRI